MHLTYFNVDQNMKASKEGFRWGGAAIAAAVARVFSSSNFKNSFTSVPVPNMPGASVESKPKCIKIVN